MGLLRGRGTVGEAIGRQAEWTATCGIRAVNASPLVPTPARASVDHDERRPWGASGPDVGAVAPGWCWLASVGGDLDTMSGESAVDQPGIAGGLRVAAGILAVRFVTDRVGWVRPLRAGYVLALAVARGQAEQQHA